MMTRKHLPKSQILEILREAGTHAGSMRAFCKEKGISEQNFYRWKRQFGEAVNTPLAQLEARFQSTKIIAAGPVDLKRENERLKILIAELYMEKARLRDILERRNKRSAA